jgi:HTH-type transcriptional regulator / antitoxin HipB
MTHPIWAYDTREFGDAVRYTRGQRNITQAELAARLGVARRTISRLEHGEAVSVETALRALAECGYAVAIAPKFSRLRVDDDAMRADGSAASNRAQAHA